MNYYVAATRFTNGTTFTVDIDNTAPTCTLNTRTGGGVQRIDYDARFSVEAIDTAPDISVALKKSDGTVNTGANDTYTSISSSRGTFDRADTGGRDETYTLRLKITDNAGQSCALENTYEGEGMDTGEESAPQQKQTTGTGKQTQKDNTPLLIVAIVAGSILVIIFIIGYSIIFNLKKNGFIIIQSYYILTLYPGEN